MSKVKLPMLTGVRTVAVLLVYLHHFNPISKKFTFLHLLVNEFHIGVSLFFVLSGFLISYTYLDYTFSLKNFRLYVIKRFARIYPMYFFITLFTFFFFLSGYIEKGYSNFNISLVLLANLTLIRGFFDKLKFTLVGQGWSLTVEETFYLFFPIILYYIKKGKRFLIIQPVLLIVCGLLLVNFFAPKNIYGFFGSYQFLFSYTFFGRCIEFFMGIYLAINFNKNFKILILKYSNKVIPTFTALSIVGIFLCLSLFVYFKIKYNIEYGTLCVPGSLVQIILLPFFISLLFFGLILEKSLLRSILETKLLQITGVVSYTFYLIHTGQIRSILEKNITNNSFILFFLLYFISWIFYRLIEEPMRNTIINRFIKR